MLFAEGTRVKLKNTGDDGEIVELLDDGIAMVYIYADDMEIPIPLENLVRAEDRKAELKNTKPVKASIVPGKQHKEPSPPDLPDVVTQYSILKSRGIQLAFDPIPYKDGTIEKFDIYLINDTRYNVIYSLELSLLDVVKIRSNGVSSSITAVSVGSLGFDQLNESPVIKISCNQVTTQGTGPQLKKELKIKAKQFFSKQITAPILNRLVHLYRIFENLNTAPKKKQGDDLQSYTRKNIKPSQAQKINYKTFQTLDLNEIANFSGEIDLHIENLVSNTKKLNNAMILKTQLEHCEAFIDKAIRLGVSNVFIIHGLGEGTLKNKIAELLRSNPNVKRFKNEYHPKYGNGATEVFF